MGYTDEITTDNKIRAGDIVAAFVTDWHKWVRVSVKKKEKLDHYLVWVIDYGVPMMVKAAHLVKLPRKFSGMQLANSRVKTGGMKNCVPSRIKYDLFTASSCNEPLLTWTPHTIEMIQKILNNAIKLQFEETEVLKPLHSPHFFGRLMVQREDGAVVNVLKCLLDMNCAKLTDSNFETELLSIDTLKQPKWTSINGDALNTKMLVLPVMTVKEDTGYTDQEFFDDEDEESIDELNESIDVEDEAFFDESASQIHNTTAFETHEKVPSSSNGTTSEGIAAENKSKAGSERTVTPDDKHQHQHEQKDDHQKDAHFKHNPNGIRHGADGKNNSYQMNDQRPHRNHQPQNQRGLVRKFQQQQQFRPPLNQSTPFNQQRYQLNSPQKPFNGQPIPRRWDNTHNPNNFAPKRQENRGDNFGSDDFNANFGKKPYGVPGATPDYYGPFLMNQPKFMAPLNIMPNLHHGRIPQNYPTYSLPPPCDFSQLPAPCNTPNRKYQNQKYQRNKFNPAFKSNQQRQNEYTGDMQKPRRSINSKDMPNVQEIEAKLCKLMGTRNNPKSNDQESSNENVAANVQPVNEKSNDH